MEIPPDQCRSLSGYGPRPSAALEGSVRGTPAEALVLDALNDHKGPVTLAALSASVALHPNTVRAHLGALEARGLVRRSRGTPVGRGRPAWLFGSVQAEVDPHVREYAGLVAALVAALRRHSPDPARSAVAAGRTWGVELAERATAPAGSATGRRRRAVVELLAALRFAPEAGPADRTVRLTQCPLLAVAEADPDVVCSIHRGLVEGALEQWGDTTTDVALAPFAAPGACILTLTPSATARVR